jgi:hypothetical protein
MDGGYVTSLRRIFEVKKVVKMHLSLEIASRVGEELFFL